MVLKETFLYVCYLFAPHRETITYAYDKQKKGQVGIVLYVSSDIISPLLTLQP